MLPTWFYIAAFAAFLIPKSTRLPALLFMCVQALSLNGEYLGGDNYAYYYVITFFASAIACRVILSFSHSIVYALLLLAASVTDVIGFLLFVSYSEPDSYNFLGFYVILTQLLVLARDSHGEFRNIITHAFFRLHLNLFV